ncbi:magnesium-translocating P-type ATPase [Streptacidiphilus sp. MAP12-16]|uniref:magnesium-translocating P-type ATPase n=1 Tax=Streptacidiphilus sp. MAP12-16 TaxID=3156300 RepID=UPI0035122900
MTDRQIVRLLRSSPSGLVEAEADDRLATAGDNALPTVRSRRLTRLLATLRDPFTVVLVILAVAATAIGSLETAAVIAVLAGASCLLRYQAEYRADRAAAACGVPDAATATVLRRADADAAPVAREVPVDQLVPGDVVVLSPGDPVPADVRLLRSDGLRVSQAALSGESASADKHPAVDRSLAVSGETPLFDRPQLCFLGSTVSSGTGTAVVLATGGDTYFGATNSRAPRRGAPTAFERGTADISRTLVWLTVLAAVTGLAVNALWLGRGLEAAAFAVAVAVGLTPEMLPVVVSTALARGSVRLARQQVMVKHLPAVHNLGAMDVLCTDKTGTLTLGRPTLSCHLDPSGHPDPGVLHWAAVNSLLSLEQADLLTGDPVDEMVLDAAGHLGLPVDAEGMTAVAALPFTSTRRRSTVVLRRPGHPGAHTLVTKGAPEDVLARCSRVRDGGTEQPLDDARRSRLRRLVDTHGEQGVALLAVARADRPGRLGRYGASDEDGLTLLGFLGVRDEPLPDARAAVAALAAQGVQVRVVTGDHPQVAARVCRDVGLDPGTVVVGATVDALGDEELAVLAARTTLFARMTPRQKARIVVALRRSGNTVGFLGDSVNDLPALAAADIGVCPEQAVPTVRAGADAVLARKDLAALSPAVSTSRRTLANIANYLRITVSSNLGNALSMIAASVLLPFLPMLPGQVLVQNLCSDLAQLALAFDRPDESRQRAPRTFDRRGILGFVLCFGLINAIADLATFAILGHLTAHQHDPASEAAFRAGWFTENLITQALAMHLLRSRGGSSPRARTAPWPIWLASTALVGAALLLPRTPLAPALGLGSLPGSWFPLLLAVLAGYCLLTVTAKAIYHRAGGPGTTRRDQRPGER